MKTAMKSSVDGHTAGTMTKLIENIFSSEHDIYANLCFDIAGVASSILATPTIKSLVNPAGWRGFCESSAM
jgi:hypothetical protein